MWIDPNDSKRVYVTEAELDRLTRLPLGNLLMAVAFSVVIGLILVLMLTWDAIVRGGIQ